MSIDAVTGKIFPPTTDDLLSTLGHRWTIAADSFFVTPPLDAGDDVLRIPMRAFAMEPEESRMFFEGRIEGVDKTEGTTMIVAGGLGMPPYTRLHPISDITEWKVAEMDPRLPLGHRRFTRKQIFHYDMRALDDTQIELFMTADGQLSRWLFDGKTWKNVKHYDLRIEGEFLIFDDGRGLMAEHDGKWCIVRDIEDANATCEAIAERVEGEPLTLVEDRVEQKNFFLHGNRLLDDTGRELFTARAARDHTDRVRKVIDFVVSRRVPRP